MPHCLKSLKVQHCLTLFTSLLECLCFAGIVLGWASLAFVLKTKGYFSSLCVNTTVNETHVLDCKGQDEQFSLIFTIASFVFIFMTLPNGFLFDRFGTRVTRLFGISIFTMGTLMTAFSSTDLPYLLYPALSLMAGGGNVFILTSIQGGNLCKSYRGTLICIATGATGSSSVVFLVIKVLDEAGISLFASFLFLSACSVIHILRTFFLLPKDRIPFPLPDDYTYGISCGKSKTLSLEQLAENDCAQMPTEEVKDVPVKPEKSFRECLKSRFFTLHVIWFSVMQLRHFFFTGTLNPTLQRLTEEEPSLVSQYINAFALTQLCNILCAPCNGLILDRNKGKPLDAGVSQKEADMQASVLSLFLAALVFLVFSICATIPNLQLQYFTFVVQMINRAFIYSGNAAIISTIFPSCHFGKLYGLVMALSAVFSLLQYACFAVVEELLDGDPLYVNIALTLLGLFTFSHPLSVFLHCRRLASQRATTTSSS